MSKFSPEKIKLIYHLWYKYLLRSDKYREFCSLQKRDEEGEDVDWPEEFELQELGAFGDSIWGVYHNQWGNIHEKSFDVIWSRHGGELIAAWNDELPLEHQIDIVYLELLNYLTDDFLEKLRSQSLHGRGRPPKGKPGKSLKGLAGKIVTSLNAQRAKLGELEISPISASGLYARPEERQNIHVEMIASDLEIYERTLEAKKNKIAINNLIRDLGVGRQTYYDAMKRVKDRLQSVERGLFLKL